MGYLGACFDRFTEVGHARGTAVPSAVVLGLSGANAKTATAGVAATSATGLAGTFWVLFAQLPLIAWLFQTALDETRSPRERNMIVRHQVIWISASALLGGAMFAAIPWHNSIHRPILRAMIIPGMLILFYIPMLISHRRLGKKIGQLRVEENTATQPRALLPNAKGPTDAARHFVLSGLAVAFWPSIMPVVSRDWASALILALSAILINLCGARLDGYHPASSLRAYSFSLAATVLVGVGVMFVRREAWADSFSNHMFWYLGTTQAMVMTYVILSVVAWRRVHGKVPKNRAQQCSDMSNAMTPAYSVLARSLLIVSVAATVVYTMTAQPPLARQQLSIQTQLLMKGRGLSPEAAQDLERRAHANPNELESRIQLLAYYGKKRFRSPSARQAHQQLALWLIEKHPDSPAAGAPEAQMNHLVNPSGYAKAKGLWLKSVKAHGQNSTVLANAAKFFLLADRSTAEEYLKKAQALEPDNAEWSKQLGHLYQLGIHRATGNARREIAAKSMAQFERAMNQQEPRQVDYLLVDLAKVAFEAGFTEKAEQYANQLLDRSQDIERDGNIGNAIHHGNLVLGRLALQAGEIGQAKSHLVEAGRTPGSPQLNSFGPNMALAKELLENGEKEVVLEYLQLCEKFWPRVKLEDWIATVENGGVPDFGSNLRY